MQRLYNECSTKYKAMSCCAMDWQYWICVYNGRTSVAVSVAK